MSGESAPVLDIPPGVVRNGTPYSVGRRWWDVNWIRWEQGQLTPIKGWVQGRAFGENTIRDAFSWRDNGKTPWYVAGSETQLFASSPNSDIDTVRNITPAGLVTASAIATGFGSGLFGIGPYGIDDPVSVDNAGQWSFDNFGRLLVSVHSKDGRLFTWDPNTPTVAAALVTNAPIDSTIVISTDERMVMLLGGKNNPRRVKWCSREDLTTWTASATNTAGGFELNSAGSIVAACKVQGGILVLTDVDAHIIEYVGAPNYYARRRISDEVGCTAKNALVSVTGGAFWLSKEGFWRFDGTVTPVPSSVDSEVLLRGDLSNPANVFLGYNEFNREIWAFYPSSGASAPNRYVFVSIAGEPYWSIGALSRTAWLNPVWDTKPIMFQGRYEYLHEVGELAAGATRVNDIYAETGQFEIGTGDRVMRVDRIWQDGWTDCAVNGFNFSNPSYKLAFKLRQAPAAPERIIGPVSLNDADGYTGVRFRSRSLAMRVTPESDKQWAMGKLRMRMKAGGMR